MLRSKITMFCIQARIISFLTYFHLCIFEYSKLLFFWWRLNQTSFYFKHVLCVCQWGAILLLRRAPLISISVLLTYFLRDTIAIDKGNFVIPHLGTLSPLFCKCFRSKRSNQLILKNILLTEISFYVELIKLNISSRCIEFHQIKNENSADQ